MSIRAVISGVGVFTPPHRISNADLVASFNRYVDEHNQRHASDIAQGKCAPLAYSSEAFIKKASGIRSRFVLEAEGILDTARMRPCFSDRSDADLSLQAEFAMQAAEQALATAGVSNDGIDVVISACSNHQRPYPAIAVELQQALNITQGYAFDMNVACSSATFALQVAHHLIGNGSARGVLIVSPEICSAHMNFRDRDSHFIFGDVATALVVQAEDDVSSDHAYALLATQCHTEFSSNVRNNAGFLDRCLVSTVDPGSRLFYQHGRKVFKEVTPRVVKHIGQQLQGNGVDLADLQRVWLHQANINMNRYVVEHLTRAQPKPSDFAPVILDEYANTAAAGAVVAMATHHADLASGAYALICSFGAGYSIGSALLQKL